MPSELRQSIDFDTSGRKLLLIPGLIIFSIATILLLCSDRAPWTNSGDLYHFVRGNRATTQIIVQVITQVFGALNVYAVCSLISFTTRLLLARSPHTLDTLEFWSALCLQHIDWSLPYRLLLPLILFRLSFFVPAAIWTGALTPTQFNAHLSQGHTLNLPQYSINSQHIWGNLKWTEQMTSTRNQSKVFTYSPNYDLIGVILEQAAFPSNSTHVKADNSGYSYAGRSYGVGSSVGLVDQDLSSNTNFSYEYIETGYLTQVSCMVNTSSEWVLDPETIYYSDDLTYPDIFVVSGKLANNGEEKYAACGLGTSDFIFALTGSGSANGNIFSIAAGRSYSAFDKVQCSVDFKPTNYSIIANRTESLISVRPLKSTQDAQPQDIEPIGNLTRITMRIPTSFSQQHACDLYTSLVGNTFSQNVQSTSPDEFHPYYSNNDSLVADRVLRGVEDSLTSMLDNSLLAFSTAQLMIAKDTKPTSASFTVSAVRIGQSSYIYATAAVNFTILLLCFFERIRTGNWRGLSSFDYTNIKSVTVGASKGGFKVAEQAQRLHERKRSGKVDVDGEVGKIKVQLQGTGGDLKLVGVSAENGELEGARGLWRRNKLSRRDTEMESLTPKHDPVD